MQATLAMAQHMHRVLLARTRMQLAAPCVLFVLPERTASLRLLFLQVLTNFSENRHQSFCQK